MKRSFLFLAGAVLLATGCGRNHFSVSGTINGAEGNTYVVLKEVKPAVLEPVDSVIPDSDGSFRIKAETKWPSFYLLSLGDDNYLTLLISPGEKIEITAENDSLGSPLSLTGSEHTSTMLTYREKQRGVLSELEKLNNLYYDSISSKRLPIIMDSLDRRAAEIVSGFRDWAQSAFEADAGSMLTLFYLNQHIVPGMPLFDPAKDPGIFFRADSLLYSKYRESDLVIDLHTYVADLRQRRGTAGEGSAIIRTGDILPEIALPGPSGDTVRLSSTRGKIVLVDFWAAWCPPCREENPNLVRMYDMYHAKGFEIFQVSLDMNMKDWTEAIRNDKLGRWIHVSDLKYRDSEVIKTFGLTGIPFNFLTDREGRVIDANLRGADLNKKLEELFAGQ